LRERFARAGVQVISLVSSPGTGKTTLLERLLTELHREYKVAALVGDLATENDAMRLARSGAPVKQITTGTVCHLDASMVERALADWNLADLNFADVNFEEFNLEDLDYLFIENVGNLVCPSSFDLGENLRLVLVSTTEGEDKPLKYPTIFNSADIAVITKIDLAEATGFDRETMIGNIHAVRPQIPVLEVSARSGVGMNALREILAPRGTTVQPKLASASNR
jgi:hydrogenase nickel incorporation protein HypB